MLRTGSASGQRVEQEEGVMREGKGIREDQALQDLSPVPRPVLKGTGNTSRL